MQAPSGKCGKNNGSQETSAPACLIYPAFLTGFRSEAAQTGMDTRRATEGSAGVLDSTSRSVTGMAKRSEVSANRRKSCPGALTKGIRHRCSKGTDLEYQGKPGPGRDSGDPRGGVQKKP